MRHTGSLSIQASQPKLLSGEHRPLTISLLVAVALVSYNNLSVAAALPSMGNDLGNVGLLPWVITAELLAAAVAILALGPTVDSYGVRRVFRASMIVFIVSSLFCAVSPNMQTLILARIVQGIASGGVIGASISTVGLAYGADIRPKVYAAVSAVWGVMGIAGPAIAAGLIGLFGWRSIFTVTLPVGIVATAIGWNRLPGRREENIVNKFDVRGLVILTVLTIGLLMAASADSLRLLWWLLIAVVFGVAYYRHARRTYHPVVELDHLTGRRWRYLHITSTLAVGGGTGASAFLPLYLKGARGATETQAAFSVLFLVLGWTVGAFISSKLQSRMHSAYVVQAGSGLLVVMGLFAVVVTGLELWIGFLLGAFFFAGIGIGSITTAGLALLQGRAQQNEMGRVSSAHQFLRSLGFAYGAAIASSVIFLVVQQRIGDVEAIRDLLGGDADAVDLNAEVVDALQAGYVWALAVTSGLTVVTMASAVKLVRSIGMFTPID